MHNLSSTNSSEKITAQASTPPSTSPSTSLPATTLSISAPPKIVPETVAYKPLEERYLTKGLRGDGFFYANDFFAAITQTSVMQIKQPLRPYAKKAYTVTGQAVFERANKNPLFSKEEKASLSKHCSTTLVTRKITPPIFGHSRDRREKLVGVIIALKDARINRAFIYDNGTIGRPYDHDTKELADAYYHAKVKGKNPVLFEDINALEAALAKTNNPVLFNEVLARLRWNLDGSSKLFIASDTLEARLLAQEYARLLLNRLRQQAIENGLQLNKDYYVPICFYLPNTPKHGVQYDPAQQAADNAEALKIYDKMEERLIKYKNRDFEFLLTLPNPEAALQTYIAPKAGLVHVLLIYGYVHIVQSLLERSNAPNILEQVPLGSDRLHINAFYYVAQAGNVPLLRWLLAKRAAAKNPINLHDNKAPILAAACLRGHAKIVEMLLQAGLSPYFGETIHLKRIPIQIAADIGRWDIVKILLDNNRYLPTQQERAYYNSVLIQVLQKSDIDTEIIKSLLEFSNLHMAFSIKDQPILHWAIITNNAWLVTTLVDVYPQTIFQGNNTGQTPIEVAAINQRWYLVEIIARKLDPKVNKPGNIKALIAAVKHNQLQVVTAFLAAGIPTEQIHSEICAETGYNLLGLAVVNGHAAMTKFLLDLGVNTEHQGKDDQTVFDLLQGRTNQHPNAAETLAIKQIFAEYQQSVPYKYLQIRKAIKQNNLDEVIRLWDDRIDVDVVMPDIKVTLLHWAVCCNADKMVTHLLTKNPNLTVPTVLNEDGDTPISLAARLKFWNIVQILGKHKQPGYDYGSINGNALVAAVAANEFETVKVLAEAGASTQNKCLFAAIRNANYLMVSLLLQHNATLTLIDEHETPIVFAASKGHWSIVEMIAEHKETDDDDHARYSEALLDALEKDETETDTVAARPAVIALIKANTPVNRYISYHGDDGCLHWTIHDNDEELVSLLLEHGADLTYCNSDDHTPIQLASVNKRWHLVKIIAEARKADAEDKARYGLALHAALAANQMPAVKALLQAATPVEKNVLALAISSNNRDAIELLQQHVANWSDAAKSELVAKYNFLRSLQCEVSAPNWLGEKEVYQYGITVFSKSAPDGILRLQQKLAVLPAKIDSLEQVWPLIETLYVECFNILVIKRQESQNAGTRRTRASDFYQNTLASYNNLDPSNLGINQNDAVPSSNVAPAP